MFWTHILPHINSEILSGNSHKYNVLEKENLTKILGRQTLSDQLQGNRTFDLYLT